MTSNLLLFKNTLFSYSKLIISSILGLVSTRLVLQYLGVSDFGLYSVVGSIVTLMSFVNTVMVTTTHRFIAFELGRGLKGELNKIFNISLTIHLLIMLLVIILSETIGIWGINHYLNISSDKIGAALMVFRLSVFALSINIISIPFQGLIAAKEQFRALAIIEIIRAIVNFIFVLMLGLFLENRLIVYGILMTLLSLIVSILFFHYCWKNYRNVVLWNFQKDATIYSEMISFSGWIMIGAAAHIGKNSGSQIIVNTFFGTILNAAFGIANKLNSFAVMFSQALSQVAIPQITKSHSGGDSERVNLLAVYVSKYSFYLFYLAALPILLETNYILKMWLGEFPEYTIEFCQLMLFNGLLDCLLSGMPAVIQANGNIKWFQVIGSSIMLASLPLAYFLYYIGYSPVSITVAYILTSLINFFVSLYLLKKIINFDVKYFLLESSMKVFFVVIATIPLFIVVNFFDENIVRFLSMVTISITWGLLCIFFFGLNKNEKIFFRNTCRSYLQVLFKLINRF